MRKISQIFGLMSFTNISVAEMKSKLFRIIYLVLLLTIAPHLCGFNFASANQPFWRKPEVIKKMTDDRDIVVSVTHEKPSKQTKVFKLFLKGAGIVNTPLGFSQKKIVEYEKLTDLSSYIKEVKHNSEKQEVFVHGEAYTFTAKMLVKMKPIISEDDFKLGFEVIRGHFTGMKGDVRLEDYGRRKTLMSLEAYHEAEKAPMPAALLDFGLEIVLQQVAKKIRQHLESEFKKEPAVAK